MAKHKITREEPHGPLRTGLQQIGTALGPENGGQVFLEGIALANGGLDAILDLHHRHGLGDPDHSIPPTLQTVRISRERGAYSSAEPTPSNEPVARL